MYSGSVLPVGTYEVKQDRPRAILDRLDYLDKELSILSETQAKLMDRLLKAMSIPALIPATMSPDVRSTNAVCLNEPTCPLADRIANMVNQVVTLRDGLSDTLNRIEI